MDFNPKIPHIVYASDNRFAEILGVSLVSLFENNKNMADIVIYVLDSGINEENKEKLLSVCKKYSRSKINFIPAKDICKNLDINITTDRGSLSQYSRLFVSSKLPSNLNRVLYLDCDIIVEHSIHELWNLNLHDKTIGALMDAFSKYYRANINLKENDIMFNSGVMLIDLKKWRENKVEEKLLDFIVKKNGRVQQGDQGVLNAILSYDTYCFDPRFNSITIFYDFNYKEMMIYRNPPYFYTEEQIKIAVENPIIIHFTTSFLSRRPWVEGCQHPYLSEWIKYKDLSPWKDTEMWKYKKASGLRGWYIENINKIPRRLAIRLSSLLQVFARPWITSIKG